MKLARSSRPLPTGSAASVRAALRVVAPTLADELITLAPRIEANSSRYWRGTARVGRHWLAKFAWSAEAAVGIERELRMLTSLPKVAPRVGVPEVVHASLDPLLFITRFVEGVPLTYGSEPPPASSHVPEQLAEALTALHDPRVRAGLIAAGVSFDSPQAQADTDMLRSRFAGLVVTGAQAGVTLDWCDWVDEVLAGDFEQVVVHGDLHGHNIVLDTHQSEVLIIADFENAGLGDPHYDLRYLPSVRPDLEWFRRFVDRYAKTSGRDVSLDRVLAWHVRTVLGDVLWRSELGVPLTAPMGPSDFVDDIAWRMDALGVVPT